MSALEIELLNVMSATKKLKLDFFPSDIVEAACEALDVPQSDMESDKRSRKFAECRFIIAGLAEQMLEMKPTQIAKFVGNRDRTTVHNSLIVYRNMIQTDKQFKAKVAAVLARLEAVCL